MKQELLYDEKNNIVRTRIKKPFFYAGETLGWGWKAQGLGFNLDIIDKCLNNKADLVVHVEENGYDYKITFAKLKNFLDTYNCDYFVKRKYKLKVVAWDWFVCVEEIKS